MRYVLASHRSCEITVVENSRIWQDITQSGYLPSHNIDPTKLGTFTQKWINTYASTEIFLAKPLVYTPSGSSSELVILVSNLNIIRALDGATGSLLHSRTLDTPFTQADAQCGDVSNFIGIIGTPYIDAATEIMYFFSKGYKPGTTSGTINGTNQVHRILWPSNMLIISRDVQNVCC